MPVRATSIVIAVGLLGSTTVPVLVWNKPPALSALSFTRVATIATVPVEKLGALAWTTVA
jgi:hypothetical protein